MKKRNGGCSVVVLDERHVGANSPVPDYTGCGYELLHDAGRQFLNTDPERIERVTVDDCDSRAGVDEELYFDRALCQAWNRQAGGDEGLLL